jgi:hypothetical protein
MLARELMARAFHAVWLVHGLRSPRLPALVCIIVAGVSAVTAAYDVAKVVTIAISQLQGPAFGTDFLNLYAGARLFTLDPGSAYSFDAQLQLQQSLTARDSLLVPFYLPPYAALLFSWVGWAPYGVAYIAWLIVGLASVLLSIHLLAPRWTRWYLLVWLGLAMLFLPVTLGLAQGQTSALLLLACAALVRGYLERRTSDLWLSPALVGWLLKPQLAPVVLLAAVISRRWRAVSSAVAIVIVMGSAAVLRLGPDGFVQYLVVSRQKTQEAISADPVFLIGPTLLHASHWFLGVNGLAHVVAAVAIALMLGAMLYAWRGGPAADDRLLLQLAILPVAAVLVSPYALIYELTPWLVSFWLLWRYTALRSEARAGLLWLVALIWIAADIGVGEPRVGGADVVALLGVCLVAYLTRLVLQHSRGSSLKERDLE